MIEALQACGFSPQTKATSQTTSRRRGCVLGAAPSRRGAFRRQGETGAAARRPHGPDAGLTDRI